MWNGSSASSEEQRPERPRLRSDRSGCLLVLCVGLLAGCHRGPIADSSSLTAELSNISGEELFRLGVWHATSGDLLRAEQYLGAARQRGHDARTVTYWLLRVCTAASRYQSALTHARQYLRAHPHDWSLRLVAASVYEALGDLERAQSELERIVQAAPQTPLPHYRLALLYQVREPEQGRATKHLEAYLALAPQGPHAAEVRATLEEAVEVSEGPELVPDLKASERESPGPQ